ncbi:MAG TPA: peptidylprolyl isomerase [Blastocatellia bacterium]|nr:peptidylprolyl isomerase [Blastocatellia bacterium]
MKTKSTRKRFSPVGLLVVITVALVLSLSALRLSYGDIGSKEAQPVRAAVVATVEGREISAGLYEMYLKNGIQALGLSQATAEGRRRIAELQESIVAELIERALIEAEAERRGAVIAAETLESRYRERVQAMGGDDAYRAYLNEAKITDADFRQIVAGEMKAEWLQQELSRDLTVAPAETQAFYDKAKANSQYAALFIEPERVRASHILINARRPQISAEEMSKRRARAVELLNQLKRGASFAELARRYSDDPASRERGGDLGWFTRDTHTPRFDEAAFALKPGQLSAVVETEYGFHVIRTIEHQPQRTRRFDEVRAQIEQQLLARKRAERLTAWLTERRRAASISINPAYRTGQ